MNKKLVKVSSAKRVFTSLNIKVIRLVTKRGFACSQDHFWKYIILVARRLEGSPEGMQFGGLAARQSSFARNSKSDGSDERQLCSQATKLPKKYC